LKVSASVCLCSTLASVCETWTALLRVTIAHEFCTRLKCVSNARHPSVDSVDCNSCVMDAVSFSIALLNLLIVCVGTCVHVCVCVFDANMAQKI